MNNKKFFLALNRIPRIGPKTAAKLYAYFPNLEELFTLKKAELERLGFSEWLAKVLSDFDLNQLDDDFIWEEHHDLNHILTWESSAYPPLLREIPDPPIILYAQGQLNALNFPALAMVGSRNPSVTGKENAFFFARELAKHNLAIISGLALGIDTAAHEGALTVEGTTVAVMGTGINRIYPTRQVQLAEKIRAKGLLLSEFPLNSPPLAGHFPRRNRIISGLSLCTLVVEAAIRSGSLITARMALEQNREVLALPGSIHNPLARGCHYLLQQGAKLVTSISDVMEEFHLCTSIPLPDKPVFSLATENENLVKCIGFEATSVDEMVTRSGYSIEQVMTRIAELELKGQVVAVPGGYMRCSL
ncbi:MAG: DNA protecting protein DprA [Legionella sp. 40-6]|nr:DNA-processing protein DprA [Legionella sp.]OJY31289.1 MAG: DNA protecting protein DprA [Legionella sp. 40-6]